jgi:hypothetical protein
MELEIIILSGINQTQKDKYHDFSHMQNLDSPKNDIIVKWGLFGGGELGGGGRRKKRVIKVEGR